MSRSPEDLFPRRTSARLRIYAWTPKDPPAGYRGLIKIGQTTRENVNERIRESQGQMHQPYTLHVDVIAERDDGAVFRDEDVRRRLVEKGFENPRIGSSCEWVRCTRNDVLTAIEEVKSGTAHSGTHHETFPMREEQKAAVEKTFAYFTSMWAAHSDKTPHFLWNAKMRFGKTFTAYQLAKRLEARRILVLTFKPAVEDSWRTDLESHVDFDGWQYRSSHTDTDIDSLNSSVPLVYFGSFQDLLGRDKKTGLIKVKNEDRKSVV